MGTSLAAAPTLKPVAPSTSRRPWAILIPLLALLVLAPSLWYPPSRDTALFLQLGDTIARGGMPYRDAWEVKTPAIYLAYALPAALGGDLATGWIWARAFDILIAGATATLLFHLAERLLHRKAAWGASLWYLVTYAGSGHRNLAQAESWANLAVVGALLLLWNWREARTISLRNAAGLGFLTSLAFCFKPTCILPILAGALVLGCASARRPGISIRSRPAAAMLLGAALPIAGFAVWLSRHGALEAFLEIQRGFVAPYVAYAGAPFVSKATFFGDRIFYQARANWFALSLAGIGFCFASRWQPGARPFLLAITLGGFAAVWLQNRAFPYHWQTMLPALSLLAGAGTSVVANKFVYNRSLPAWAPLLLLPLLWHALRSGDRYWMATQFASGRISQTRWIEYLGTPRSKLAADQVMQAADYVAQHPRANDRLLVWGFENELNVLANRRGATNYLLNPGLVSRFAPARWRRQFLAQVTADPPAFLAVICDDDMRWLGAPKIPGSSATSSYALMQNWPEFRRLVEIRYDLVRSGFHLDLYRLKQREGERRP